VKQPRLTAADIEAAKAARGNIGRTCRFCGGSWFRVASTWLLVDGRIRRQRVCGRCGQDAFLTVETATNGNVPQMPLTSSGE
jgi:hypothetical protein